MLNPSSLRQFLVGGVGGVAGAIALNAGQNSSQSTFAEPTSRPMIKPPALKEGDTIAIIAPAAYGDPEEIVTARKNMESYGFRVVMGKNLAAQYGYLAGTDEQRADDISELFLPQYIHYSDPKSVAIIC